MELSQNSVFVLLSFLVPIPIMDNCVIDTWQWAQAAQLKWQTLYR